MSQANAATASIRKPSPLLKRIGTAAALCAGLSLSSSADAQIVWTEHVDQVLFKRSWIRLLVILVMEVDFVILWIWTRWGSRCFVENWYYDGAVYLGYGITRLKYENTAGPASLPNYVLQPQFTMDSLTLPTLVDLDNDGDLDMILGTCLYAQEPIVIWRIKALLPIWFGSNNPMPIIHLSI